MSEVSSQVMESLEDANKLGKSAVLISDKVKPRRGDESGLLGSQLMALNSMSWQDVRGNKLIK